MESVSLVGTMAVYGSQAEVAAGVPTQWREFRLSHPELHPDADFYGASPCTDDHKIHYLTGVAESAQDGSAAGQRLILAAGEYAVVRVEEAARLRDTWVWMLTRWLPASGLRERKAPEFEKFKGVADDGLPLGPVEIWIPLEPLDR
ncbi:MAG TPA: GyrI-like domain-containing protein [Acidobacteriaceae bacterium]|nr:GyrI-like domain-containing protein [Acidobacteriaceae bacterium]